MTPVLKYSLTKSVHSSNLIQRTKVLIVGFDSHEIYFRNASRALNTSYIDNIIPCRTFLSRFAASENTFYINRQYMYIVFILQYQTAQKTTSSLSA